MQTLGQYAAVQIKVSIKLPKVKDFAIGENSPHLVTLILSEKYLKCTLIKFTCL
jgi:hypothetical protein